MGDTMTRPRIVLIAVLVAAAAAALAPPLVLVVDAAGRLASQVPPAGADAQTVSAFQKTCGDYVALHKKIVAALPRLPQNATPQQIDLGQQALSKGIVAARASAKVGDVFLPGAQAYLRQVLQRVFSQPDGKQLRASILDENPIDAAVRINGPYPDAIPLSTMPPQILNALPKLPDELEYRFVGERLILFDHHAHLVVDYLDRALPRV
jgi:hypothetical protein